MSRKKIIAVIGGHVQNTSTQAMRLAEEVGVELGRRSIAVICGGFDGIMEAVCRGCKKGGGTTLAILKGNQYEAANDFVDYVIPTSMDVACNNIIVWSGIGLIAFEGRYGTLNEMALALDFKKPLICVGPQKLLNVDAISEPNFIYFSENALPSAEELVDRLEEMIQRNVAVENSH